jgi:hypothetical protein
MKALGGCVSSGKAYTGKILHDARPANIPVQRGLELESVMNLKALGLTVPSLLARTDCSGLGCARRGAWKIDRTNLSSDCNWRNDNL